MKFVTMQSMMQSGKTQLSIVKTEIWNLSFITEDELGV